jgi:Tfp pilus assembly protein PilV
MMRKVKSESGFGLVSTMVAMVLLGIAVTALSSSGMMVLAVHTDSAVRSAATAIASSYLEEVKARAPQALTSESAVRVNEDGVDDASGVYIRSLEVAAEEGLAYTKRITVKVEYPNGMGRKGKVELVTVIYEGDDR